PKVAATPRPSPVAASAPPPDAEAARLRAHDQQEEAATVVRDVPVEALAAIAAATAAATAQGQSNLMPPAAQPGAVNPPPAAAQAPAASLAPAFRGTSAFGGLSKKMTLIGTAPPANWPPRGAETSVPPPDPAATATASATPAATEEPPQETQDAAPEIQATESEGDLDALLGDEAAMPPTDEQPPAATIADAPAVAASTAIVEKKADLPIVSPDAPLAKRKSRSGLTIFVMIVLWLIALGAIWFVARGSM
ncbi:MAG: hypothetical protein ABI183_08385, partial [Polyangiaceae bacterium]